KRDPASLFGKRGRLAYKKGAFLITGKDSPKNANLQTIRNDCHSAGIHRNARGLKFCCHSAAAASGFLARDSFNVGSDFVDFRDEFRLGVLPRVVGEETFYIGKQNQYGCVELTHDEGAELIVITEASASIGDFEFGRGDGVILVDNWDNTHVQQGCQCMAQIQISLAAREILLCEQDLSRSQVIFCESLLVKIHQTALS